MTFCYIKVMIRISPGVIKMAEMIEGYINRIIFRNEENGYTVLSIQVEEEEVTCVGNFTFISEGEFLQAQGSVSDHPVYGEQFLVESYDIKEPENLFSMERYLSSGAIKGVGGALAGRIVKKFRRAPFESLKRSRSGCLK